MPRQVDHELRRRQIAEALLRLTACRGLEAVSLRTVAAEAGLSMGAVQHYFGSKDEMLLYAVSYQDALRTERITTRVLAGSAEPTPKAILRACVAEFLPITEQSRTETLVGIAFFIRALSEPALATSYAENLPKTLTFFAEQIRQGQRSGTVAADRDPEHEAEILWGLADAQGTEILLGHRTPEQSLATLDYHLDRLFGA
ncbi:TetR/AcrR family transcriptional regulator [Amycolatopsis suaedae]|uniref:TetR family transcriptional regulator n=1 Tax=Amycolatopsis suaedae TaxID=2510978 RepID=A0A4Q7IZR5_9PSEU|nr:TetR/AcrR family transcriptional regulator [Amycolatopsis suaedae]RZQ59762.1 TetR family transcriptional regulator [Amycolatopsis suaedae]